MNWWYNVDYKLVKCISIDIQGRDISAVFQSLLVAVPDWQTTWRRQTHPRQYSSLTPTVPRSLSATYCLETPANKGLSQLLKVRGRMGDHGAHPGTRFSGSKVNLVESRDLVTATRVREREPLAAR